MIEHSQAIRGAALQEQHETHAGRTLRAQTLLAFLPILALAFQTTHAAAHDPIALHPENPHYFLWRGEPTILITSGEHYGAVL
ncbi:MAG: hypothetical protein JW741_04490, partial [Sedimentisphaerales bacterium]|nr:hypothetical protein [Sedimentisphaerales bacterium]